ncbi:hypothetical protein M404DRAFT_404129 [Pisolithus tinctorius Marx 270]|uniref:Uncharacterized protein n=1 Tax=Pisolithus tinctorius Marx 270 TaxID=870435 RepID=A0A0C3MZ66_PISTI|nr:hypothetical protein M404DRAFT_404129 [Pisolithus tinctorius Marx 270]
MTGPLPYRASRLHRLTQKRFIAADVHSYWCLLGRGTQISPFEGSHQCGMLLLSIATCDNRQLTAQIRETLTAFLGYTTLSHRWSKGSHYYMISNV